MESQVKFLAAGGTVWFMIPLYKQYNPSSTFLVTTYKLLQIWESVKPEKLDLQTIEKVGYSITKDLGRLFKLGAFGHFTM